MDWFGFWVGNFVGFCVLGVTGFFVGLAVGGGALLLKFSEYE
jgi:hypothetical protein